MRQKKDLKWIKFVNQRVFFMAIVILAISTVFCLINFYHLSGRREQIQNQMLKRISYTENIYSTLEQMESGLAKYMSEGDSTGLDCFISSLNFLKGYVKELKAIEQVGQNSQNYLRRMQAFVSFQESKITSKLQEQDIDYPYFSYLKGAVQKQKEQAAKLCLLEAEGASDWLLKQQNFLNKSYGYTQIMFFVLICSIFGIVLMYILQQEKMKRILEKIQLQNAEQEKNLIEAKMSMLRAQINPHFLFNTLNLIGKTALLGQAEITMQLIEATAKILRYSLRQTEKFVPIKEEIDLIDTYFLIQKLRFGENISLNISVNPKEANYLLVPPMLIQPIVENSFKHGFRKSTKLHIDVTISQTEKGCLITISDDGDGFDVNQTTRETEGIGISNVKQRLFLLYKRTDLFNIVSQVDEYTCVSIFLPQIEN